MSSQTKQSLGQFEDQSEVGQVNHTGSCDYNAEQQSYTVAGAGANIWGAQDAFHFVWKRIKGNFIATMRAGFVGSGGNPHRKLGWMARTSLEANPAHVSAAMHEEGVAALQFRRAAGGPTEEVRADLTGADVIQLERNGNNYIMSVARYGEPFTPVQAGGIDLGEDIFIGLFVCSHEEDASETAIFRDVRIVRPVKASFEHERDPFGSHLEILDIQSGHRRIIYSAEHVFEAPNWTRDGKALIFNREGRLYRFDLATGTPTPIDTGEAIRNNNDHVLSFDGNWLAISNHGEDWISRVYTVPIQGGQPTLITPNGPSYSTWLVTGWEIPGLLWGTQWPV